ncbi:MAG: hypothetical protein ACLQEQ_02105 [Nitrososphaerales archaeon]
MSTPVLPSLGSLTLTDVFVTVIGLIILWIVISIPAWLAGKAITEGKSTFGDAMVATLVGPIVYFVILIVVDFSLGTLIGSGAFIIALILAFIAWIWVYKSSFRTSWLGGLGIAILAIIIFAVMSVILGALFGIVVPASFFPHF